VEEAQQRILSRFTRLSAERVPLDALLWRVLAEDISSGADVPPFANSSMDGFALRSGDTSTATPDSPVRLQVTQQVAAGATRWEPVTVGTVARIMTGAPLPDGADSVVPFEDVEETGELIVIPAPVRAGACIRPAAQDVRRGQELLRAGTVMQHPQIALLAAVGMAEAPATRRPRVAILATGDELVPPGEPLRPGQIYNSNSPMLAAAVREAGGEPMVLQRVEDTAEALREALERVRDVDLILTSGGASVGDYDHVRAVVAGTGEVGFWRVRLRPGKPLLFGSIGGTPIVGLPGNPTSAAVTFELFVRPAIRTMVGASPWRPTVDVVLDDAFDNRGGRRTYFRVSLRFQDGAIHATAAGGQDSAMIATLSRADGLLLVREEDERLEVGERATALVWRLPQ
jgi:molybdopterin molybdotransferase